jgi:hypothetical protein
MDKAEEATLESWIRENFVNLIEKPITTEQWFIAYLFHKNQKHIKTLQRVQDQNMRMEDQISFMSAQIKSLEKRLDYEQDARRAALESLSNALDFVVSTKQA